VESDETLIAMQRLGKQVPAETNTHVTIKVMLGNCFILDSPRDYITRTPGQLIIIERELSVGNRELSSERKAEKR
jgi:hypothetical protein